MRCHASHKLKSVSDNHLEFENGNRENYDVLVGIPPHRVPEVVRSSGLTGGGGDWVAVDKYTMKTPFADNVYAVGDVTEIKVGAMALPKAGIFAEEEAKVAAGQIIGEIAGRQAAAAAFNGQGYCFMEVGNRQAGYLGADFFNPAGPVLTLEPPSPQNFEKKQDFEKIRVKEWLLK